MPLSEGERENIATTIRLFASVRPDSSRVEWLCKLIERLDAETIALMSQLEEVATRCYQLAAKLELTELALVKSKAEIDHLRGALDHEDSLNRAICESLTHMDAGRRERSED